MAYPRYKPGQPLGPGNPYDATTENRMRDSLEELEARYALPGSVEGEAAITAVVELHSGEVVSATAARAGSSSCGFVAGEVVAREHVAPSLWDQGDYLAGDVVTLPTADAFSDTSDYAAGAMVVHSTFLYQADDAITAGAFNAAEWTLIGTPGDNYCAAADVDAGPWVPAEWNATDAEKTLAATRSAPADWNGGSYEVGDAVTLPSAAAFDPGASYTAGDLAVESGTLYQADGAISPGAFNAAEWTEIGTPGDTYRATATTSGAWVPAAWTQESIPAVPTTVETSLLYHRTVAPEAGAHVVWINGVVVEVELAGSESMAPCGNIEVSGAGGFAVRFTSPTCTGAWSVLGSLLCNDVAITEPPTEPS